MKKIFMINLLVIILIIFLISIFTYIDTREYMLEGFTGNNNKNINDKKIILFYADWCGYCKKMKPEWDKLKRNYKDNCEEYESEEITEEQRTIHNIKGYPSISIVTGEEIIEYNGERSYVELEKILLS